MSFQAVFFDIGDTLVANRQWLPGARQLLADLRSQGMRLGLVSNTGELNRDELSQLLPEDFDFSWFQEAMVLLSSEVGVEKPALSIFMMAISHAGCSPWETLFVAETIEETLAAQAAGMQAIRICHTPDDFGKISELLASRK